MARASCLREGGDLPVLGRRGRSRDPDEPTTSGPAASLSPSCSPGPADTPIASPHPSSIEAVRPPVPTSPGRPAKMTPYQARLLAYLHDHPWMKEFRIRSDLNAEGHRFDLHDRLKTLERKGLAVRASGPGRVVLWGPAGVPPPSSAMLLIPGAPSMYHAAHLQERIVEVLAGTSWLTLRMIRERISPAGTPKAVDQAVASLLMRQKIQRRLVETPIRQFYVYALPGHYLTRTQRARLDRDVVGTYGYGEGALKVKQVLERHPWLTAKEISGQGEIRPGYVYNVLESMQAHGVVDRLRILEPGVASGRGVVFKYALTGVPPPDQMIAPEPTAEGDSLARMAVIIHENPGTSSTEAYHKYQERYRQISKERAFILLNKLESLGVISNIRKWQERTSWRKVWQSNGQAAELMASRARVHVDLIERHARKLRALGFDVQLEISPAKVA